MLLAASSLALGTGLGRGAWEQPAELMSRLSDELLFLERALEAGEAGAALSGGTRMVESFGRLAVLRPEPVASDPEFDALLDRSTALVGEIQGLVEAGRLAGAAQAAEELRASCVSCHVKLRDGNDERGLFPARGGTVSGRVLLRDARGDAVEDRSHVLVFLESTAPDRPWSHQRDNPSISQRDRSFHPRVLPVVRGTMVDFPNDDSIFHNVFSLSKTKPFDLGTYRSGESRSVRMDRAGLVKIYCNIHPEMHASVVVLGNPWFTLADAQGRYVLTGVEAGDYVLRAWNDMGAEATRAIRVTDSGWLAADLELDETVRVLTHRNKLGQPYRRKY